MEGVKRSTPQAKEGKVEEEEEVVVVEEVEQSEREETGMWRLEVEARFLRFFFRTIRKGVSEGLEDEEEEEEEEGGGDEEEDEKFERKQDEDENSKDLLARFVPLKVHSSVSFALFLVLRGEGVLREKALGAEGVGGKRIEISL